ncbi:hypothetical protein MRX96_007459 [Rhipicephalus microplus]
MHAKTVVYRATDTTCTPHPKSGLCSRCGDKHDRQEVPSCIPSCILSGDQHLTGTGSCKARNPATKRRSPPPQKSTFPTKEDFPPPRQHPPIYICVVLRSRRSGRHDLPRHRTAGSAGREWFENGQTIGKDVDRLTLVAINPWIAWDSPHCILTAETRALRSGEHPCFAARPLLPSCRTPRSTRGDSDDLGDDLRLELRCADLLTQALGKKRATETGVPHSLKPQHNQHRCQQVMEQKESEALADLLQRYRAAMDVGDLWMTTEVRLLMRTLSTRALEDDAWLRGLEDLVSAKMDTPFNLHDTVSKLCNIKGSTHAFSREAHGYGRRRPGDHMGLRSKTETVMGAPYLMH